MSTADRPAPRRARLLLPELSWSLHGRRNVPLLLLLVDDFTGREDRRPIEDRKPVAVNLQRLHEVKKEHGIQGDEPLAWGALHRLLQGLEGAPGVEVRIMNASRQDLLYDFEDSPDTLRHYGLYRVLGRSTDRGRGEHPYGAVLFGGALVPADRQLLEPIGRVAEFTHAPCLFSPTGMDPEPPRDVEGARYFGFGDVIEAGIHLGRSFAAFGYSTAVAGLDPRIVVASRVAHLCKVIHAVETLRARPEVIEAFVNGWLAEFVADPDDGERLFRAARIRVSGEAPELEAHRFELELAMNGEARAPLGAVRLSGVLDKG
jgi:hypothetical protein